MKMRNLHHYIQDYMGNNRMVVTRDDTIKQITHYYPYGPRSHRESIFMLSARRRGFSRGQVIGDISTNENLQKFKFEGKVLAAIEKIDNLRREDEPLGEGKDRSFGLDSYDVEARQYFAMAPMWDRIDKKAEDYYGISPYAYCGGDPVNYVDPDGKDFHYLDEHGQISMTLENSEYDQILFVDKNGEWVESNQYEYGTIEIRTEDEVSFMTFNDDKVGNEIFQMLADNTNIEWSQLKTDGPLGASSTYISTSGETGYEGTGIRLINRLSKEGFSTVREWNHNHPSGSLNPSGIRSGISNATGNYSEPGTYGDIGAAKMAEQKQPGIQMNIYANGKYQQFNSGGKVGLPFSYTKIGILTIKTPIWK